MLDTVWRYLDRLTSYTSQLDRQHWLILSVIVLGIGMLCMRGFGSRTNY
jgi:hypothetical protein